MDRSLGKPRVGVDARIPGRKLGPAAKAWAESRRFRRGRAAVEAAIFLHWDFDPADGAAVNSGGGNPYEEASIEARVARSHRVIANIRIKFHELIMNDAPAQYSPFPDIIMGLSRTRQNTNNYLKTITYIKLPALSALR